MNKIFKRSFCLLFLCITFLCSGCSLLENNTEYQKEKERSLREAEAARKAMDSLSAKQKELVMMLYGPDPITVSEYAAREGVSQPAISNRLKRIRKKLKKFL